MSKWKHKGLRSGKGAPETRPHVRASAQAFAGNVQGFGNGIIVRSSSFKTISSFFSSSWFESKFDSFEVGLGLESMPYLKASARF
jgi:hypothetical protein